MALQTKVELELECHLTDAEKLAAGKELGDALEDMRRIEERLASFKAQVKAEASQKQAEIGILSQMLNTGRQYRSVDCEIRYDWAASSKTWIRLDTGEIVKVQGISDHERQQQFEV